MATPIFVPALIWYLANNINSSIHWYYHHMLIEGVLLFYRTTELFIDLEACTVRE